MASTNTKDEFPFIYRCIAIQDLPSKSELSPFAKLPRDDWHFGFAEYLSLLDMASLADASYDFNRYAEEHIFPSYTVLDMSEPRDFPPDIVFTKDQDLRPILNKIGPYVHTVALRGDLLQSSHHLNVHYVILACTNLRKLHLENIDMAPYNLPIRFCNFGLYAQLMELNITNCGPNTTLPMNFRSLRSLVMSQNSFAKKTEQIMFTLRKNMCSLKRFGLLNMDIDYRCFKLLSDFYRIKDISLSPSDLCSIRKNEYEHIEIDKPLSIVVLTQLKANRFPKLCRLSANYANNASLDHVREHVQSLFESCLLQELHLIAHTIEIGRLIKKNLTDMCSDHNGKYHLHVFVYNYYEDFRRRWLSPIGFQAKCQLPVWNEELGILRPCPERHVVNRLRPICNWTDDDRE